jgi:ribosome biogenesis GTPase
VARSLDEDDVRIRPGRGKSRPRSKDRPAHTEALGGMVLTVDRGRFTVAMDDGTEIYAIKARELGRKGIVTGDMVQIVGDTSGDIDTQARIVRRDERSSNLRRTADDSDPIERVIVANATQLAIVTATTNPDPSIGLIDRALVAAIDAGITPILIITKSDLRPADELQATYAALGADCYVVRDREPSAELITALTDHLTVLIGHSGVGKSTLVNALVPGADRSTGHVNVNTGKGRHTSTSAMALPLPSGGWIIDTPGIRSFGLAHVDFERLIHAFPELADGVVDCPRACSHDEAECALDAWADSHGVTERLDSLRRLLRSAKETDKWSDQRSGD